MNEAEFELIKTWFEKRFNKKPEHDTVYFNEWVGRFRGLKDGEMDLASRKTWKQVKGL